MTVKERLEKVKETADLINPDIRWLVEQVERVQELESLVCQLTSAKNIALELLDGQTKILQSKQFQREAMESQVKRLNVKIERYKKLLKRTQNKLDIEKSENKLYEQALYALYSLATDVDQDIMIDLIIDVVSGCGLAEQYRPCVAKGEKLLKELLEVQHD